MSFPVIHTNYGPVKGLQKNSCYEKPYNAFYAIPYADKAIGEYRFKSPRPLSKWTDVLDATKPGDSCWLFDKLNPYEKNVIGSYDCLHLNIYTPNLKPTKPLPVMIFFHGGRYTTMSGHPFYYGPDYLMERDVILVTFNFRMGVFGFLSLQDRSLGIPGNAGMKDQVMAMKWIKENIQYFGGDANNITIFGESSGATSVHYHLLSERSKDLFNRAIIMSGSAFVPWAFNPHDDYAYRLVKALGYEGSSDDEEKILKYLEGLKPEEIVLTQETIFTPKERRMGQFIPFAPVIEPYITDDTFIASDPFTMTRNAWGNKIDIMIGGCSDEGLLLYARFSPAMLQSLGNFSGMVAQNIRKDPDIDESARKGLEIKKFYYADQEPNETNIDTFFLFQGHKYFWHGTWLALKSRRNIQAKSFLYRFDVEPTSNKTIRDSFGVPHMRGACHVEDLFYIFKAEYLPPHVKDSNEYRIMQLMTDTFTSFARDGHPNSQRLNGVKWDPVVFGPNTEVKCLNITNNDTTFIPLPETKYMKKWDEICEHNDL